MRTPSILDRPPKSDTADPSSPGVVVSLRGPAGGVMLLGMSHTLIQAVAVAQDLEARGFLGTVGKIAAATIIFFVAIGLIVGLLAGFFLGRAVGRRQGTKI